MDQAKFMDLMNKLAQSNVKKEKLGSLIVIINRKTIGKEYMENGEIIYPAIHRNTLSKYLNDAPKNIDIELFLTIALLYYEANVNNMSLKDMKESPVLCVYDLPKEKRNERYQYVNELFKKIMNRELYARDLHEGLLIMVCRGIITLPQVFELEDNLSGMFDILLNTDSSEEEKRLKRRLLALQKKTQDILSNYQSVQSIEEFESVVLEYCEYFYSSDRVPLERIRELYRKRNRFLDLNTKECDLSFSDAISIFAPKCHNTYKNLGKNKTITREWLIDLLMHLRFSREEINEALGYAHFTKLSTEKDNLEKYITEYVVDKDIYAISSSRWYQTMETKRVPEEIKHFYELQTLSFKHKMALGIFLFGNNWDDTFVPIDHILEALMFDKNMKSGVYREVDECVLNPENSTMLQRAENISQNIKNKIPEQLFYEKENVYFHALKEENKKYFYIDQNKIRFLDLVGEAEKDRRIRKIKELSYAARLFYTVLTGKYYSGQYKEIEMKQTREIVKTGIECETTEFREKKNGKELLSSFLNTVFSFFLNDRILYTEGNNIYLITKNSETGQEKKSRAMSREYIMEGLMETLIEYK